MTEKGLTAYDVAGHYDRRYFQDLAQRYRARNRFARQRIANVFSLLPDVRGARLLDVGCGMGTFTVEAARRGAASAMGVDFAPEAVATAREVAAAEGVRGATFVEGDATALPLPPESLDVVLAADVTEHLDDATLAAVLAEARRVLRPGGTLVLYTPEASHIFERLRNLGAMRQDPSHIGIRSAGELAGVVRRAGLDVTRTAWLPSHLPGWNLLERAFARWVPLLRRRIGIVARKPGLGG
ncbi:MAG TPA: methyltransferase domain-containing protein [Longimicrobiales bacterium]|nr:methyltransferase domain-containing protein [Longimicrobiales bacterium]